MLFAYFETTQKGSWSKKESIALRVRGVYRKLLKPPTVIIGVTIENKLYETKQIASGFNKCAAFKSLIKRLVVVLLIDLIIK